MVMGETTSAQLLGETFFLLSEEKICKVVSIEWKKNHPREEKFC